jgi:hypothetical protein
MDIDTLTKQERAVLRAKAQLDAFDLRHHGTWFRSKDHDRAVLLGRLADALEALADARLGPVESEPADDGEPTDLARDTIPEIERLARRHQGRRLSKTAVAARVGIDRGTLDEWIRRGWLTWPPETR